MKKNTIYFTLGILFSSFCFPYAANAEESLDVFEEYAVSVASVTCENFFIETYQDTAFKGVLKFTTESENITVEIVTPAKNGDVTLTDEKGGFSYTPHAGYTGTDSFQFSVSADGENSNIAYCGITVLEKPQSDVPEFSFVYQDMQNHWANYSATKLVERDILKGERIGSRYYFHPETKMRRIDVIEYILASLKADFSEVDDKNTHIFADSADLPEYINHAAYLAKEYGFLQGISEGDFVYLRPYEYINRAEIIRMIDLAMKSKTLNTDLLSFVDAKSIPDWAVQSVKNLVGYGIIGGFDDNTLRPYDNITKAQAAQMLYQMIKYLEASQNTSARIKSEIYGTIIL